MTPRLHSATWTGLCVLLGCAVCLHLLGTAHEGRQQARSTSDARRAAGAVVLAAEDAQRTLGRGSRGDRSPAALLLRCPLSCVRMGPRPSPCEGPHAQLPRGCARPASRPLPVRPDPPFR